jgi:hypothetical protein
MAVYSKQSFLSAVKQYSHVYFADFPPDLNYNLSYTDPCCPVRIRVRIDPPHPLVCRKWRLNGAVLRMIPEKRRPRATAGVTR